MNSQQTREVGPMLYSTAMQTQKAVSAYFTSNQILHFAFAKQYISQPFVTLFQLQYNIGRASYLMLAGLSLIGSN